MDQKKRSLLATARNIFFRNQSHFREYSKIGIYLLFRIIRCSFVQRWSISAGRVKFMRKSNSIEIKQCSFNGKKPIPSSIQSHTTENVWPKIFLKCFHFKYSDEIEVP